MKTNTQAKKCNHLSNNCVCCGDPECALFGEEHTHPTHTQAKKRLGHDGTCATEANEALGYRQKCTCGYDEEQTTHTQAKKCTCYSFRDDKDVLHLIQCDKCGGRTATHTQPKEKKQDWEEIVKEIMQTGFDIAMGGDMNLSEEQNKVLQEKKYDEAVYKYVSLLEQTREEVIEECKENVKWILTPHEYESDNPEYEGFALKLKEKYCKKICDSISSLQLLKNKKK